MRYLVKMTVVATGVVDADGVVEATEQAWELANMLDSNIEPLEVSVSAMDAAE
jgi:hypothetical protein